MPAFLDAWTLTKAHRVLIGLIILLILSCLGYKNVSLDVSYQSFFDDDDALLQAMIHQESTYSKYDNMLILVGAKDGTVFTPQTLHALHQLTEQAWLLPYASRVDSILNFNHIDVMDDELSINHLFDTQGEVRVLPESIPEIFSERNIQRAQDIIMSNSSLVGNYISEDGATATVFITFEMSENPVNEPKTISTALHQMVENVRESNPNLIVHVTGTIENSVAFMDATVQDVMTLIPLAYAIMVVLLVVLLKSVWGTIITLTVVSLVTLITMGIKTWVNGDINSINAFAPTMIMTIAVADCIHILVSFFQSYRSGLTKADAINQSLRTNFKAILLTSVTTAIGFACLNFHASPLYRELGNIVALGVMIAFAISVTVLPAFIMMLPIKPGRTQQRKSNFMVKWAELTINHHRNILWCFFIGIVLVIAYGLPKNTLNEKFTEYLDDSFSFREANDFLSERIGGLHRILYSLESGKSHGVNTTEYLTHLDQFSIWLKAQPEVAFVASYGDIQKRINKAMNGDQPEFYRIAQSDELISQFSLLYELSLPYGQELTNIVNLDKSSSLLVCILYETDSNTLIAFNDRAQAWLKAHTPESMHAEGTGLDLMFSKMAQQNIPAMVYGTFYSMLFISLILLVALKSWTLGVVSVFTNILPALLAFSFWGMVDGMIGIGVAAVATLTLGLVVDDTIHFLHRFNLAIRSGKSVEAAISTTLSSAGVAMLVITAVFAGGFAVLSASHYSANADLGLMTSVTILIAVLIDLILLPALLLQLYRNRSENHVSIGKQGKSVPKPEKGLLGHLPLMAHGEHGCLYDSLMKVREEQGDIFQLDILNKPWVVVSDHSMIQSILIKEREHFPKAGDAVDEMKSIGGDLGILVTEGKQWLRQRQLVMPAFRPEQLKSMMTDMNAISHEAVKHLQNEIGQATSFEFEGSDFLNRVALAIICHVGFDYRIASFKSDENIDPLLEAQELQCKELMKRIQRTKYWKKLPLPSNYRLDKMMAIQYQIFKDIIQQHAEGQAESKVLMNQLMTALDDDGQHISEDELIQLVHSFIAAGHETSGAFLQWTLYYLATHPELQQALRQEILDVMGGEEDVSYEHYQSMEIMDKVLKESLRLRPPIPIMLRSAGEDVQLEGYAIKKDTPILLMLGALQKDKRYWGDKAEFFDIDHFDKEAEAKRERFVYAPFGLGPRVCVGHRFAMIEATVILAQLLKRYQFSWVEGQNLEPILSLVWTTKKPMRFNVSPIDHQQKTEESPIARSVASE